MSQKISMKIEGLPDTDGPYEYERALMKMSVSEKGLAARVARHRWWLFCFDQSLCRDRGRRLLFLLKRYVCQEGKSLLSLTSTGSTGMVLWSLKWLTKMGSTVSSTIL